MKALFLLLICGYSFADGNVYRQILINKPGINKIEAKQIAHHISMVYSKYKIPKIIYAAILMQESFYNLKAINTVTSDYCMAQINIKTARAFNFNTKRLLNDLKYCIEAGAIVLSDFQKRHAHKEVTWFTRYNSSNPLKRKQYLSDISRWMPPKLKVGYEKK